MVRTRLRAVERRPRGAHSKIGLDSPSARPPGAAGSFESVVGPESWLSSSAGVCVETKSVGFFSEDMSSAEKKRATVSVHALTVWCALSPQQKATKGGWCLETDARGYLYFPIVRS